MTAEYFPKRDRAYATSIFNAGSAVGALIAPFSIGPLAKYFRSIGWGNGWEMAFIIIGALGFVRMGFGFSSIRNLLKTRVSTPPSSPISSRTMTLLTKQPRES